MRNCRSCDFLIKDPQQTVCVVCGFDEYSPWGHSVDERLTDGPTVTEAAKPSASAVDLEQEVRVAPVPKWTIVAYVFLVAAIVVPLSMMAIERYQNPDPSAASEIVSVDEPATEPSAAQRFVESERFWVWGGMTFVGLVLVPLSDTVFGGPKGAKISERRKMR